MSTHLLLRPAFLILMLIISCVVLVTPLIVAASGGASPPVGIFEGLLSPFESRGSRLHSRQTLDVPPDCVPICEDFSNAIDNCLTAQCACTVQNMNTGFSCVECAVSEIPGEAIDGQAILNNFAADCAARGFPINSPTVTLSGTVVPSTGTGQTYSAPTESPPTGIPSKVFTGVASTSGANSSGGPTGPVPSTTGSVGGTSGAIRVGNEAGVMCVLLSVWLTTALTAVT